MIYITTTTKSLDGLGALWSKTKQQVKKQDKTERDKLPSLKLKLYLFASADAEQQQDQRQLTSKEKKDDIFPGPPTYASSLTIKRNTYGGKIKPAGFFRRLEQANQFFKQECDKESD